MNIEQTTKPLKGESVVLQATKTYTFEGLTVLASAASDKYEAMYMKIPRPVYSGLLINCAHLVNSVGEISCETFTYLYLLGSRLS